MLSLVSEYAEQGRDKSPALPLYQDSLTLSGIFPFPQVPLIHQATPPQNSPVNENLT
jgi:hypothetical protein